MGARGEGDSEKQVISRGLFQNAPVLGGVPILYAQCWGGEQAGFGGIAGI